MRGHECIGLSQGENVSAANLVGESAQVKVNKRLQIRDNKTFAARYFGSKVSFEKARCYPHATQFMRAWMRLPMVCVRVTADLCLLPTFRQSRRYMTKAFMQC